MNKTTCTLVSTTPVGEWRGSISLFEGLSNTRPSAVHNGISWTQAIETLAPEKLRLVHQKEDGLFFLPTTLHDAPLSGVTLERAKSRGMPLAGKMRSASHVVAGTMLKLDLDGVAEAALAHALENLEKQKIAYIAYTTHSHGLKSGIRARLVLPLDVAAPTQDYRRIACSASEALFSAVLDPSEGFLYQLAGCAVAHPDRRERAFRLYKTQGFCVHTETLLDDYLTKHPDAVRASAKGHLVPTPLLPVFERTKIAEALTWIDASDYQSWCSAGMMLKAAGLGELGFSMWLVFSEKATGASKQRKHEGRYDPETMWDRFSPSVPGDVAVATIFARAKEATTALVLADLEMDRLDAKATAALEYLHKRHTAYCKQLVAPYTRKIG